MGILESLGLRKKPAANSPILTGLNTITTGEAPVK